MGFVLSHRSLRKLTASGMTVIATISIVTVVVLSLTRQTTLFPGVTAVSTASAPLSTSAMPIATAPTLSTDDIVRERLTSLIEVPEGQDFEGARVSRNEATELASDFLGVDGAAASVYHGFAPRYVSDPPSSSWIVVIAVGRLIGAGPAESSIEPVMSKITGVIIDDQTGAVLRGFTR
jgi:hypothetical protein